MADTDSVKGFNVSLKGAILSIQMKLDTKGQVSSTGKSNILFSTRGYKYLTTKDGDIGISVNVIRPLKQRARFVEEEE